MLLGVVLVGTPAGAHVSNWTHNWTKHIRPKADARYLQPTVLKPGKTLRGAFAFANDGPAGGDIGTDAISFPVRLPSKPLVRIIDVGATPPPECPGTVALPKAKAGYLCIYVSYASHVGGLSTINPESVFDSQPAAGRMGAWVYSNSDGAGRQQVTGTWAVTARKTTPPTARASLRPAPADNPTAAD
jgi:hypothetical protein